MARAPFQVLVLPFRLVQSRIEYAVFKRADAGWWQGIAGGGEGAETALETARRETREEAGIPENASFIPLDSKFTVPAEVFGFPWGQEILVVPEFAFGVESPDSTLRLSSEHTEARWVDYETARQLLKWDSNRNALWELHHRLTHPKQAVSR